MKKIAHTGYGQTFRFGVNFFCFDLMVATDIEWTTEDILSVKTGYKTNIFRYIENFVSLDFWSEMKKIAHTGMVKFSDLG